MIICRTTINNNVINALANYHNTNRQDKNIAIFILGNIFLIFTIINAYGLW